MHCSCSHHGTAELQVRLQLLHQFQALNISQLNVTHARLLAMLLFLRSLILLPSLLLRSPTQYRYVGQLPVLVRPPL